MEFSFFATASRPVLWHTQPHIQWLLGVKRLGREPDHSLPSNAEVKNAWSYTPSWRRANLSTGTTLPLHILCLRYKAVVLRLSDSQTGRTAVACLRAGSLFQSAQYKKQPINLIITEVAKSSVTLVSCCITKERHKLEDHDLNLMLPARLNKCNTF
jgi:hypothetical protein